MTSTQEVTPTSQPPIEEPALPDSLRACRLFPNSSQSRASDWSWRSDGLVTVGGAGGSEGLTIGKRFEATFVPTSALAWSYASKSTEGNVGKRDDGICAATALTYQRLRREATSWNTFLKTLQANPILSVMRTRKTNAHDCKPATFKIEGTIRMVGMRDRRREQTVDEIASAVCLFS